LARKRRVSFFARPGNSRFLVASLLGMTREFWVRLLNDNRSFVIVSGDLIAS
jgi:hypothetical protein